MSSHGYDLAHSTTTATTTTSLMVTPLPAIAATVPIPLEFINSLSLLSLHQLKQLQLSEEDCCPICLVSFGDILSEKPNSLEGDSTLDAVFGNGVTRLEACGHVFCLKDLVEWINGMHGNCPTCRHTFLNIRPPSDSDDESSDGGEYIPPGSDDDDETESLYDNYSFSFRYATTNTTTDIDNPYDDDYDVETNFGSEGFTTDADADMATDIDTDIDVEAAEPVVFDIGITGVWQVEGDIHDYDGGDDDYTDSDTDGDSSFIHSDEAFAGEAVQMDDGSVSIHEDSEVGVGTTDDIREGVEQK
ncbi:hypothetical protein L218DRAFT_959004 [Marasmius fiardii PR-910]|nr:hypothetical protein L218DRAFT_959004 [Marasmius fiardii PR-910]